MTLLLRSKMSSTLPSCFEDYFSLEAPGQCRYYSDERRSQRWKEMGIVGNGAIVRGSSQYHRSKKQQHSARVWSHNVPPRRPHPKMSNHKTGDRASCANEITFIVENGRLSGSTPSKENGSVDDGGGWAVESEKSLIGRRVHALEGGNETCDDRASHTSHVATTYGYLPYLPVCR